MDFFDHPRYVINKSILRLIGRWPYADKGERIFFTSLLIIAAGSAAFGTLHMVYLHSEDSAIIMEAVSPFLVNVVSTIKLVNCILNNDRICQLLQRIKTDWQSPMGPEEKVLGQFSDDARKFVVIYLGWIYSATTSFMIVPMLPKIIVAFGIANMSAPAKFPFPCDYYVDSEKYYFCILMVTWAGTLFVITSTVAPDVLFVVFVQHGCGIFSAIGYRLENLIDAEDLNVDLEPKLVDDVEYWIIRDCVKKHKEAIQFVELLDSANSWSFLLLVGLNMGTLAFTGFQVVNGTATAEERVRQFQFSSAQLLHLFFESFFSQRLTDHSLIIFEALHKIKWYKTSLRTRRLINFMLMRSIIPFELKAGKVYTMSMANFSAAVRTSMSYVTILSSLQ